MSTTRTELFHLRVPLMPQRASHRAGSCHETLCLPSLVATSHGPHRHRIMPLVPWPGWNMPTLFLHTTVTGFSSSVGAASLANLPFLLALVAVPIAGRDRVHPQAPVVAAARAPVAEHEVLLAVESPAHEAGNILELRG